MKSSAMAKMALLLRVSALLRREWPLHPVQTNPLRRRFRSLSDPFGAYWPFEKTDPAW